METANHRMHSTAGFTLLEIMIALGVLGLILSALYGSYRAVTDSIVGTRPQTSLDQKGRFFVQQLSRQVRCCYGGHPNEFRQRAPRETLASTDLDDRLPLFQGNPASLDESLLQYVTSDATRSRREFPGCLTVVSYKFDKWRHVLLVSEELYGMRSEDDDKDWRVALEDVVDIEFEYFDGKEWQNEWDSLESGGLPKATRVTLTLESPEGHQADVAATIPILCTGSRTRKGPEVPADSNRLHI